MEDSHLTNVAVAGAVWHARLEHSGLSDCDEITDHVEGLKNLLRSEPYPENIRGDTKGRDPQRRQRTIDA